MEEKRKGHSAAFKKTKLYKDSFKARLKAVKLADQQLFITRVKGMRVGFAERVFTIQCLYIFVPFLWVLYLLNFYLVFIIFAN